MYITELLAGIVARFEVTFSLNRKELQLKSTDEQVWAAVDKEAITKILSNLLNNALKYASQNVLVELEKGEDSFTIRVTSDGNKIPAEVSQYIFEPFYQVALGADALAAVGSTAIVIYLVLCFI